MPLMVPAMKHPGHTCIPNLGMKKISFIPLFLLAFASLGAQNDGDAVQSRIPGQLPPDMPCQTL